MSDQKIETPNQAAAPAVTPAEAPAPKLAAGLFRTFTLGSTLEQAPHGNTMNNMKPNMMDYVNRAGNHKNQSLDPETLAKIGAKEAPAPKVEEVKKSIEETLKEVPAEQRELVLAELDKRIDEAKKSNNESEVQKLEKAKDKAKKCYGPQMDAKQPKEKDLK